MVVDLSWPFSPEIAGLSDLLHKNIVTEFNELSQNIQRKLNSGTRIKYLQMKISNPICAHGKMLSDNLTTSGWKEVLILKVSETFD